MVVQRSWLTGRRRIVLRLSSPTCSASLFLNARGHASHSSNETWFWP